MSDNSNEKYPILKPDDFKASLNNLADLPNYLEKINQNIINIEKRISKKEFNTEKVKEITRVHSFRSKDNKKKDQSLQQNQNDALDLKNIVKQSVEGINDILSNQKDLRVDESIKEDQYGENLKDENLNLSSDVKESGREPNKDNKPKNKQRFWKPKNKPFSAKPINTEFADIPENNKGKKGMKLDISTDNAGKKEPFPQKPYKRPNQKIGAYVANARPQTQQNALSDEVEPSPVQLSVCKTNKNRCQSKSPVPNKNVPQKKQKKLSDLIQPKDENVIQEKKSSPAKPAQAKRKISYKSKNKMGLKPKNNLAEANPSSGATINNNNPITSAINNVELKVPPQTDTRGKKPSANLNKKSIAGFINSKPNTKPSTASGIKNNMMYSKKYPEDAEVNDILKLMLVFNEYLINIADTKFSKEDKEVMVTYSKALGKLIKPKDEVIITQNKDNNASIKTNDKSEKVMVIQKNWREYKIKKLSENNSIQSELSRMVINNLIEKEGFGIMKLIGMLNSSMETFVKLKSKDIVIDQLIEIQKNKFNQSLYKNYINSKLKKGDNSIYNANNENNYNSLMNSIPVDD